MKKMTSKEFRELLKGKIVIEGCGNFVLPGFEDIHEAQAKAFAAQTKVASEDPTSTYNVKLHLSLKNWVDGNPPVVPPQVAATYHRLDRVPGNTTAGQPATYGPVFNAPLLPPPPPGNTNDWWFSKSFDMSNVAATYSLMDVLQHRVGVASSGSHITFGAGDISSSFLTALNFAVDAQGAPNHIGGDPGDYGYDPSTGEGHWEGWGWMFYIGTPAAPTLGQTQPSGSSGLPTTAYPGIGLGTFTVPMLFAAPNVPLEVQGTFTLSYEKSQFTFTTSSATENGELVCRISGEHSK